MMLEPDAIGDPKTLAGFLRNFGIELTKLPALPVSLNALLEFLRTDGVSADAINAVIRHVRRNAKVFGIVDGDRITARNWPDRTLNPNRRVSDEMYWSERTPIVTRQSKIVSLGASVAVQMAEWLQHNGYRYLVTEPNVLEGRAVHGASARWGAVSSAHGFSQVVSWAFGLDKPPLVVYRAGHEIRDPFREGIVYTSDEAQHLEALWRTHTACARAALQEADVIVLILDANEVYRYLPTGHYLHHTPLVMSPALWEPRLLSVDDNVETLKAAIERLRGFNPNVRFIVGLSPEPLLRTFRREVHVAAATAHSKAVLRVALEQLSASVPHVHYMASFETAMYPGGDFDPWMADECHLSDQGIGKVMRLFQQQFCDVEDGLRATRDLVPAAVSDANPYFEVDHRIFRQATEQCIARGLVDAVPALDMLNHCTPALYKNDFYREGYVLLRWQSVKSLFNFNILCREMYRQAFPTTFAKAPQSEEIYKGLGEDGYYVIAATPQSRQFAAEMLEAMASMPTKRQSDGKIGPFEDLVAEDVPGGFRFYVPEEALPVLPAVKLLEDLGVLRAIGDELGHPILRAVNAWHSVRPSRFGRKDESDAAQMYHADNDTPTGWLKVFIYLTDVSEENGPHVFVPGSHRERPVALARDGRFSDEEVERHFGPGRKLTGPAGTVIVENTQGFHKALTVRSGTRTIFELECVNCLFGAITERHAKAGKIRADLAQYDSRFLLRYTLDDQKR